MLNQPHNNPLQAYTAETLIQYNVPLSDKNWFRTGGVARFYAEPHIPAEFAAALEWAYRHHHEVFILGEGANILISDEGFKGLVIRPRLTDMTIKEDTVTAQAGVSFNDLIEFCLNNNLSGLEEFSGIPGTVGGSVFINIHYFEFLLSQFLVSASVINKTTGALLSVDREWFNFGYNYSTLHNGDYYLVSATFQLKKLSDSEIAYHKGRRTEIIRHRVKRYPNSHTCGSFFRNFYEHEIPATPQRKKIIFVAYYLDKIGIKGNLNVGDAIVSYQHANMLVNQGNATTNDIIDLVRTMQQMVKDAYGIIPQPECRLIGFDEYPLL